MGAFLLSLECMSDTLSMNIGPTHTVVLYGRLNHISYRYLDNLPAAELVVRKLLAECTTLSTETNKSYFNILWTLTSNLSKQGKHTEALLAGAQVLEYAREFGDYLDGVNALRINAVANYRYGDLDVAETLQREAAQKVMAQGEPSSLTWGTMMLSALEQWFRDSNMIEKADNLRVTIDR